MKPKKARKAQKVQRVTQYRITYKCGHTEILDVPRKKAERLARFSCYDCQPDTYF